MDRGGKATTATALKKTTAAAPKKRQRRSQEERQAGTKAEEPSGDYDVRGNLRDKRHVMQKEGEQSQHHTSNHKYKRD